MKRWHIEHFGMNGTVENIMNKKVIYTVDRNSYNIN